jgi:glycosyltransferase involved in cell wall biosynthesis
MKKQPLASVIMAVYNGERFLAEAIESILGQTFKDFELIIVDDGSNDNSPSIIKSYKDTRIKVISQKNQGLSKSCNNAIAQAKGKYIIRHDADDISDTYRFEKQILFLEKNSNIALVGSNYHVIDDVGNILATTNVLTSPSDLKLAEIFSNQFGHGAIAARRQVLEHVGLYDQKFIIAQDYDLWTRVSHYGQIANLKEPLYSWRSVGEGLSTSPKRIAAMVKEATVIREREFQHYRKHRADFKLISIHPLSTKGGIKKYFEMKNTMYRDMALAYCSIGLRRFAVPVLALAILHAPWSKKTYRQVLITVFYKDKLNLVEYEYI